MTLSKKIAIPLAVVILATSAGGGWYIWQGKHPGAAAGKDTKATAGKQLYTCAMHPFIIKDKPGLCPVCNMALIKKIDGPSESGPMTAEQKQHAEMLGHVSLSPTQAVMANVATVAAAPLAMSKEINAVGIVQYDQSRQAKVTAWTAGRIDKLNVNTVGSFVSKNSPVAEVYSPDLVATQQEYLLALKSRKQLRDSPIESISGDGEGLVRSARERLMLLGVKEKQIADLEKAGKPNIRLSIYAPQQGVVIEKLVQQGQYVNTGDVLFNIADLSTVWIELEVYENEFANLHVGQAVELVSQSFPGKRFRGKISYLYPFLDPKTRTIKARVQMPNPGMKLKPDMFVNALIKVPLSSALVVPSTAVIDTGKRQVVWVEKSAGMFEPRDVQVGQQTGDNVQILSGLKAGEKVAVSGGYLIDSESQLRGGGGGQGHGSHGGGSAAMPNHGGGAAPAMNHGEQGHKSRLDMEEMSM